MKKEKKMELRYQINIRREGKNMTIQLTSAEKEGIKHKEERKEILIRSTKLKWPFTQRNVIVLSTDISFT